MNIKSLIYSVLEYFKQTINFFIPGYFSDNCRSVRRIIKHNNLKIKTVYDIGAFKGMWYKERKKSVEPNVPSPSGLNACRCARRLLLINTIVELFQIIVAVLGG